MSDPTAIVAQLRAALGQIILGKQAVVDLALTAALAGGHILLEDVPGVGKTTLAHAMATLFGCSFQRIQFTSDLLPSDITGISIYNQSAGQFEFKQGPIFAQMVLADEINRTTPKTQSSLLEAMNEGQISVDNNTWPLPRPFLVIATQNPQDHHGTYPLPESQLDRFMIRLRLGYPDPTIERQILRGHGGHLAAQSITPLINAEILQQLQQATRAVHIEDAVLDYLLALVQATRRSAEIELGVSTRGALAFQQAVRARAMLDGRRFALPDDVKQMAAPILGHRIRLAGGGLSVAEADQVIQTLVAQVPVPV